MFGHSSVHHKHRWSLNPPLPLCQGRLTVLAQTKYMDVCVLDLYLSVYINRLVFTSETNGGARLSVSAHDYV